MTEQRMLLSIEAKDGDSDTAAELSWDLAETLRESPAEDIERPRAEGVGLEKAPVIDWVSLAVTFTGGLPAIIGYVRGFLHRQPDASSITVEIAGDRLVIERADPQTQERLVQAFLSRHPGADP